MEVEWTITTSRTTTTDTTTEEEEAESVSAVVTTTIGTPRVVPLPAIASSLRHDPRQGHTFTSTTAKVKSSVTRMRSVPVVPERPARGTTGITHTSTAAITTSVKSWKA